MVEENTRNLEEVQMDMKDYNLCYTMTAQIVEQVHQDKILEPKAQCLNSRDLFLLLLLDV